MQLANKEKAFRMYYKGDFTDADIAAKIGVSKTTIENWKKKDKWEERASKIVAKAKEKHNKELEDWTIERIEKQYMQDIDSIVDDLKNDPLLCWSSREGAHKILDDKLRFLYTLLSDDDVKLLKQLKGAKNNA